MSSLSTSNEIPYTAEYLKGRTTSELYDFVQRQPVKWSNRFPCDATTSWQTLKSQLLKPSNGFTRAASVAPSSSSHNPTRNPSPAPSDNLQELERKNEQIKIYIERDNSPTVTAKLFVPVIDVEGLFGGLSVAARDLVSALQDSPAAVEGPFSKSLPILSSSQVLGRAKLLCHDPEDNDPNIWTIFVSFASDAVEDALFSDDVEFLPISSDHKRLTIRVEIDTRSPLKRQHDSQSDANAEDEQSMDVDDPNFVPLNEVKKRRKIWSSDKSSDVKWLQDEMARLEGHTEFVKNCRRRKLDNDSIVAHWKFIASTAEEFVNKKLPKTHKTINVEMVYEALGISRGTFYMAKTASKMLTDHGEDPKIVKQLKKAEGSTGLGAFLVQFEKDLKKAKETHSHKA
ncbi:hypothetical protein HMN09_00668200 [Mycena chlorophos]|uniref:Uncharacterized protein n=1 Tax=Mycena chlorophos TaxID=658473 RepID=A0A8H6SY94_MYCCL|nr:hypothetical protein HMN09_00668200 [Mycena chlorophos]